MTQLQLWPLHAFHCSNISWADTASSTAIPVKKSPLRFQANPAQSYQLVSFHAGGPTERFKHGRLLPLSRFSPINNVPQLREDLSLKKKKNKPDSTSTNSE